MSADEDLMEELLQESGEHLEGIEPAFLEMESELENTSQDLVNQIFRAMHSIKGGFGFFGKDNIVKLAHVMENVLMLVRDGKAQISSPMVEALLSGTDTLKEMIDDVGASESVDISQHLTNLAPFTNESVAPAANDASATSPSEEATVVESVEVMLERMPQDARDPITDHLESGQNIFIVSMDKAEDQKRLAAEMASTGEIIYDGEWLGRPSLIVSTVLERDLMSMGLDDISGNQFYEWGVDPLPAPQKKDVAPAANKSAASKGQDSKADPKTKKASKSNDSIRVRTDLLSRLVDTAGELILGRNRVMDVVDKPLGALTGVHDRYQQIREHLLASRKSMVSEIERKDINSAKASINREYDEIEHMFKDLINMRLSDSPGVGSIFQNFSQVSSDLQNGIMGTRLQPVSTVFSKFPRVIRDMNIKLGKEIELIIEGETVELDKSVIEGLGDPLTHLVRNSADHGVETPDIREAAGKSRKGTVKLIARHEGGQVHIIIEDDGAGINTARIREKAIENGMMTQEEADELSEKEAFMLIFAAGFSTAKEVSDVSGRGVGMDVVRTNIEQLGGRIEVDSAKGVGSKLTLILPLTLAIISSIEVECCDNRYVIPQVSIEEMVRVTPSEMASRIATVGGKPVLKLRDQLLPLARLDEIMGVTRFVELDNGDKVVDRRANVADRRSEELDSPSDPKADRSETTSKERRHEGHNRMYIVVLKASNVRFGLVVDKLHSPQEVVVKPLSDRLKPIGFYAGATIRSDGNVAMILDADGLSRAANLKAGVVAEMEKGFQHANIKEAQTMLEFQCGGDENFAINLSMVARIEEVTPERISRSGNHEVLTYEDSSLRLMRISDHLPVTKKRTLEENRLFVLVPRLVPHTIGIIIEKPRGIFETQGDVNTEQVKTKGVHGTTVIDGRMIHFLNLYSLFEIAAPELYTEEHIAHSFTGLNVILAEDTALYRTVIADFLKSLGFARVETAVNGQEAFDKINNDGPFDLLVTDIVMPEMDGMQLTQAVRKSDVHKDMPIVAVTSLMNDSDRKKILASGVDSYQQKLDKATLTKALTQLLSSHEVLA